MLTVQPISAFSDNYIWLLTGDVAGRACVVDPGDAAPVIEALQAKQLTLDTILVTHHHFDHVGGLPELIARYQPLVYGPGNPAITGISHTLSAGDRITVLGVPFDVLAVPGHTLDHIAYYHAGETPLVFCGDTLFAGGCGRLFEGDPAMMLASLDRLAALPAATRVYCAHEYTLGNLKFARAVEPDNAALAARQRHAMQARERGEPTVPSELALELETNPFLRSRSDALRGALRAQGRAVGDDPVAVFAAVRSWKDHF